ncbi:transposase [Plantactinospora soyae]|uniref:transposase n=1 Tax=Plantactinospora soyae TaxID=1544732 RepID=UPI0038511D9D
MPRACAGCHSWLPQPSEAVGPNQSSSPPGPTPPTTADGDRSNRSRRRLSRTGNRQLNAALHRIAMTQARCHQPAKNLITRRKADGDGWPRSAVRAQATPVRRRLRSTPPRLHPHWSTEELSTVPNRRTIRVCGSNGVSGLTYRALCLVRRVP